MKKHYISNKTGEWTEHASEAITWHRRGDMVQVNIFSEKGLHKVVHIEGAAVETSQRKQDIDNRNHCKSIAQDVEDYANGRVYRCPMCEEIITVPSDWSGEKYKCSDCGNVLEEADLEPLSLWDYFNDVYDIEYRIGSDKELRSVQIMVACGGPNIFIDTDSKQVELYWWSDRASYPIDYDVCDKINNYFEEIYKC